MSRLNLRFESQHVDTQVPACSEGSSADKRDYSQSLEGAADYHTSSSRCTRVVDDIDILGREFCQLQNT